MITETRTMCPLVLLLLCVFVSPVQSVWDHQLASEMGLYAFASYCPDNEIADWTCHWCKKVAAPESVVRVHNISSKIAAFVGYVKQQDAALISWRGTYNAENWIKNLEFKHVPTGFSGGSIPSSAEVHHGFLEDYYSLNYYVLAEVEKIVKKHNPSQLLITGHSLGAALAMLTLAELPSTSLRYIPARLIDFGEPRVGNKAFASWVVGYYGWGNITRVIHHRDIVPHVPPHAFKFEHAPQEIWNNGKKYIQCSTSNGEDPHCSDSVNPLLLNIFDHASYMGNNWLLGGTCAIYSP
eukprot:TRINITY_DN52590_c0_g1_i1.p1 TRINITY_DN52590_c0_g1~~TRINITY_DN52590_c0_g1_i1.p1  ORF type:complete len:295 (+),score=32.45 TRINITY_DN52590_c0_g1_i1:3-887(+)